jgi:hypothetical protein
LLAESVDRRVFSFEEKIVTLKKLSFLPLAGVLLAVVITLPIDDTLLIAAGFPAVRTLAEEHYERIIALEMTEFEKMDGGLSCLSLRY